MNTETDAISVIGRAESDIPVDTATIDVGVCKSSQNRNECVEEAVKITNSIIKKLLLIPIPEESVSTKTPSVRFLNKKVLKTVGNVSEETIERNGVEAEMHFVVKIPLEKFAVVYETISAEESEVSVSVSYGCSDYETRRNQLLKTVGADARIKAEIMASSVNAKLGKILKINYNGGYQPGVRSARMLMCNSDGCSEFNVKPEDIHLSEEAEFVWSLIEL